MGVHKENKPFSSLYPIKPTVAYDTYWKFAHERNEILRRRISGEKGCLTNDSILEKFKFTNAYRACDRVSQYLIKNVIYSDNYGPSDLFIRIILFKLFNKIETWELLENRFGTIAADNFKAESFSRFLDSEMNHGRTLYSNAYMMASGCREFRVSRKHQAHMLLVDKMLKENVPERLQASRRMQDGYQIFLEYPLIGSFLAYQYITDINYSPLTDFSEGEFTVPGPGAKDGIRKCFSSLGGLTESELIRIMADRQELEFERLGLDFQYLGGRKLQYIDIQNIFCETDKYCRVAHPELSGISGRTKIKQLFSPNHTPIDFFFPPKWHVDMEAFYGRE